MIKPEKLPFIETGRGPAPKYPFATMKVGTSFIVAPGAVQPRSWSAYVCKRSRTLKRKFLWSWLPDGAIQVFRKK